MRAIIADDEPVLREHLTCLLQELWPELEICAALENGHAALESIRDIKPDIAFLDIRMPGLSGMEIAQQMDDPCRVVFITAYEQYAVQAFEYHAVDYLLKPLTSARLQATISRLKAHDSLIKSDLASMLQQLSSHLSPEPVQQLQWIRVQQADGIQLIHIDDIAYFKAEDKYTIIRTQQSEHIIRTSLKDLEKTLNKDHFWRIHRNAIVNVRQVERLERHFAGKLTVHLKKMADELSVSRSFAHLFQQM